MLYSDMFPATMAADREARLPGPALAVAAARYGTPVYVIDMAGAAAAAARLEAAFGRPWLRLFSPKANDLPAITSFLHGHGWPSRPAIELGRYLVGAGGWLVDTALEGRVWESTDSLGQHLLPAMHRGDLVAIGQAGAYGASFTSRYNGRPPVGEVLLWPDGSLQPCERPAISGASWPDPVRAPHVAARHLPQGACRTVGSPPATKESLP